MRANFFSYQPRAEAARVAVRGAIGPEMSLAIDAGSELQRQAMVDHRSCEC
jgi:hypothetical protein